ncbi:hypothetical protein DM860_007129 [Cuscuta australis]|uniref:Uncharacterized protein n=1 Tax=Cuscuta australis TaxID=267555 RepID=A0A328E6D9_9ASTE|nr:hypothetical protein DM860_007129 [Cuscuta australis]
MIIIINRKLIEPKTVQAGRKRCSCERARGTQIATHQQSHSTVRTKSMLTSEMGYDIRNGRLARANLAHIHQSPPLLHPLHSNPGQHAQVACKHWAHRVGPPHPECVFK